MLHVRAEARNPCHCDTPGVHQAGSVVIMLCRLQSYRQTVEHRQSTLSYQCNERAGDVKSCWAAVSIPLNSLHLILPADLRPRQKFITTTVRTDHATLMEIYAAYENGAKVMCRVRHMIWTLVLQPLFPVMAKKSQPDVLGLGTRKEPLVIVLFTVVWKDVADDELVDRTTRGIIGHIDRYAASKGTADPYRYLNDCDSWQSPFDGYGADNKRFLQEMSRKYDPDGLFQRACIGGFKLDMDEHT